MCTRLGPCKFKGIVVRANQFFEKQSVSLTPLSPLHIGCGEDYEPTNFVADSDKQILYFFDPSLVPLTAGEKKRLGQIARSGSIREIYKFYDSHFQLYSAYASNVVPFDRDIRKKIEKLRSGDFGVGGLSSNRLEIPRTMYSCKGKKNLPYVPGSTMKGAIHTAFLDRLSENYKGPVLENRELDKVLLKGTMNNSPMKLISLSDFLKDDEAVSGTRIIRRSNISKKKPPVFASSGVPSSAEVVIPGEYRPFAAEITLKQPLKEDDVDKSVCYRTISEILKDLNRFNLAQFSDQADYWSKGSKATNVWLQSVGQLLEEMTPRFEKGTAALVRIGMNTGAQNLTIRRPGFPKIISRGTKGSMAQVENPTSGTVALIDTTHFQGMLPFGWAILEFDNLEDEPLKRWCSECSKLFPNQERELVSELVELKKAVLEKQAKRRQEEECLKKAAIQKEQAEAEEKRRLDEMPETMRRLSILVKRIEGTSRIQPGSELSKEIVRLLSDAEQWSTEDQHQIAAAIGKFVKSKGLDAGNVGKGIKQQLRKLRGE